MYSSSEYDHCTSLLNHSVEEHNQIRTIILKGIKREGEVHWCPATALTSPASSETADRLTQRADTQENETAAVKNEEPAENGRPNSWEWEVSEGHSYTKIPTFVNIIELNGMATAEVAVQSEPTAALPCEPVTAHQAVSLTHRQLLVTVWSMIMYGVIFLSQLLHR